MASMGLDDVTRPAYGMMSWVELPSYTLHLRSSVLSTHLSETAFAHHRSSLFIRPTQPIYFANFIVTTSTIMGRDLTKIVYKPSPEVNEEFIIIVNPAEVCTRDFRLDLELTVRICV